ncbi:Met-10+ like-protein-domain-containing protein [Emericellopsis atlantica]|uniref:tRNA (guanine(37)-N1)-methyltransferase n=1 Tax=Emericellopsis atlantica TaxID=2614577 RepID=A0A9P8CPY3_9HYPO|nr:Met-10+ like-protein-domain-containing protein [Emericellopsis atlantica]KAG9255043.1 Met-10+ like-protein-domain-containing protein [Emericellopsis atlantica]
MSTVDPNMFRVPAARALTVLDRSLFHTTLPVAAALVNDSRQLSRLRKDLDKTREILNVDKVKPVVSHPDPEKAKGGLKALLLQPDVKPGAPESWSAVLKQAKEAGDVDLIPYSVQLDYYHFQYLDILRSIIPEELHDEIPTGFNSVGHVAHLNLREQYLPYKHIIGQVILDKNAHLKTVINKLSNVGTESEFRTFPYEVLAGPDDLNVEVKESGCIFQFDYGTVYWNSKLSTEHERIVDLFQQGDVVVDVMAGIGPFAVPAGKKNVFVWANDKNPESFKYLEKAIDKNRVGSFVRPYNEDGHEFIKQSADLVLAASGNGEFGTIPGPKPSRKSNAPPPAPVKVPIAPVISHFVMNLPASALEFLHNFRGLYHGQESLFAPHTQAQLPMVHAHCFAPKPNDEAAVQTALDRVEKELGVKLVQGNGEVEGQATVYDVRDVAPQKLMFCVSFRLPKEAAFAPRT